MLSNLITIGRYGLSSIDKASKYLSMIRSFKLGKLVKLWSFLSRKFWKCFQTRRKVIPSVTRYLLLELCICHLWLAQENKSNWIGQSEIHIFIFFKRVRKILKINNCFDGMFLSCHVRLSASLAKWWCVCLRTKWLWVRVPLQSFNNCFVSKRQVKI